MLQRDMLYACHLIPVRGRAPLTNRYTSLGAKPWMSVTLVLVLVSPAGPMLCCVSVSNSIVSAFISCSPGQPRAPPQHVSFTVVCSTRTE
jgi:hypothetical protein